MVVEIKQELRPCYVNSEKALFHKWSDEAEAHKVGGILQGDPPAKFVELRATAGIVEFTDGTIKKVSPEKIRFCDNKMNDLAFPTLEMLEKMKV